MTDLLRDLSVDTVLSRRYRLEKRLGSGATAAVWQARDLELGRLVAIKLLLVEGVPPELAARFEREGMILGRLSHPNIVRVFATGNHKGRPYLVMELVEGEPLTKMLEKGAMDIDQAVDIAAAVAAGLAAAHQAGIVHRDVKPSNIICSEGGTPRLVDFGIAWAEDLTSITGTHLVMGTASYLSPEQARGDVPGPASDVYSLGCVLYEALTGKPPFDGDSALSVAYRHLHDAAEPPKALRPELPDRVAAVVERCLAKDPSQRYPGGAELEDALRALTAPAAGAAEASDEATETVVIAPVRDETMVLPAVAADDELIDPVPLAPVDEPDRRWVIVAGIAVATVVLLMVLAVSLAGRGGDDDGRTTTESTFRTPPSIVSTTVPTTVAPDVEPAKGSKGRGKRHD